MDEREFTRPPSWPAPNPDTGPMTLTNRMMHWGPLFALFLISYIGIVTTFFNIQWLPLNTILGFINQMIFLQWNFFTIGNLLAASYVGPGYVPKRWKPHREKMVDLLQACVPCGGYKVPRSHHCSKCNRCCMKMDHHCPWINNCVGHRNHAYFIRFLSAAVCGCIHALILDSFALYYIIFAGWFMHYGSGNEPIVIATPLSFILLIMAFAFAAGVAIALSVLLYVQIKYVVKNKNGIEEYIDNKAINLRNNCDEDGEEIEPWVYPYDLGWKQNIAEVLGNVQSGRTLGNGTWWPVKSGCDQFTFTKEQLRQKRAKMERARQLTITKDFDGKCWTIAKYGFSVFRKQPCIDSSCLKVSAGDIIIATRGIGGWVYGHKSEATGVKGWVPIECTDLKKRSEEAAAALLEEDDEGKDEEKKEQTVENVKNNKKEQ
ncbi:unnamed protein product [Caenorhabditis bovis]|uniref:Palmitoyltransferase n=1 Tax=Caenorhabditis bovis TaxID=2654633 RepID=A0A8S1FAH8_9PELO|nr:unnamed protein product [Caenorhabditis bovis]